MVFIDIPVGDGQESGKPWPQNLRIPSIVFCVSITGKSLTLAAKRFLMKKV